MQGKIIGGGCKCKDVCNKLEFSCTPSYHWSTCLFVYNSKQSSSTSVAYNGVINLKHQLKEVYVIVGLDFKLPLERLILNMKFDNLKQQYKHEDREN